MKLLVFDMDGVLVDVRETYREAIRAVVKRFTGREIPHELVQRYKNAGGWNNDWALAHRICADLGSDVDYRAVVDSFQAVFLGERPGEGLIARERWFARPGLLEELAARYRLAIFTGRPRGEARLSLDRFAPALRFDPMVTDDDGLPSKPAPDGLLRIAERAGGAEIAAYVGDTVDDARSARAAGVPFVGIAAETTPAALLRDEGAVAVLEDINGLPPVLEAQQGGAR